MNQKYIVTDTIWLGEVLWEIGTELTLIDWQLFDKHGKWLNINFIKDKIQKR